jgi:hypothetical protein
LEFSADENEKNSIRKALKEVKDLEDLNKKREKEMSQKMFKFPDSKKKVPESSSVSELVMPF